MNCFSTAGVPKQRKPRTPKNVLLIINKIENTSVGISYIYVGFRKKNPQKCVFQHMKFQL
jgi:hypothetical protein